jgi:hypothetical protein
MERMVALLSRDDNGQDAHQMQPVKVEKSRSKRKSRAAAPCTQWETDVKEGADWDQQQKYYEAQQKAFYHHQRTGLKLDPSALEVDEPLDIENMDPTFMSELLKGYHAGEFTY